MNVAALLCTSCLALVPVQRAVYAQAPVRTVALGYVLPDSADSRQLAFDRGARLGMAEAQRAASLLRRELSVIELSPSALGAVTAPRLEHAGALVVVAPALVEPLLTQLARWAGRQGRALIAPSMAGAPRCAIPLFRTGPDSTLRARIVGASYATASTRPGAGEAIPPVAARVELWHPGLERFGARQLSDRYTQRYGTRMTSDAWEGWMAIKVAWESAVRAREGTIVSVLEQGAFDGHKGAALRFGSGDRILRQPLFLVPGDAASGDEHRPAALANALSTKSIREMPWPAAGATPEPDSAATSRPCR